MSAMAGTGYTLRRAAAVLGRRPWRFLLGIAVSALAIALLIMAAIATWMTPQFARLLGGPQINVFVTLGTSAKDVDALQARLAALPGVPTVTLIPRDKALAELAQRAGTAAADLRGNPLPDVLVAQYAVSVDPTIVEQATTILRDWSGVDAVQFDLGWYRRLIALAVAGGMIGAAMGIAITLLSLLALTAAAAAQVRVPPGEATVLRMAGASTPFIVRPHACAAALTLGLGAMLALSLIAVGLNSAQPQLAAAASALGSFEWPRLPAWLPIAVVASAAALGWLTGAAVAYHCSRPALS